MQIIIQNQVDIPKIEAEAKQMEEESSCLDEYEEQRDKLKKQYNEINFSIFVSLKNVIRDKEKQIKQLTTEHTQKESQLMYLQNKLNQIINVCTGQ